MNQYVTGSAVKSLRLKQNLTQKELAETLMVSDKTISKWETGKGYPDISLLEPLAAALGVSVAELLSGEKIENRNRSANLLRSSFYVCPICGNVISAMGNLAVSCCGIALPPLEAEQADPAHQVAVQDVEDEQFLTVEHPMTKRHFISFLAYVTTDKLELVKLYPEGPAQARFLRRGHGRLYSYCNQDGLFVQKI